MNLANIKALSVFKASRLGLKVQKNSPAILVGVGITALVGATVTAVYATTKASDIMDEHDAQMAKVAQAKSMSEKTDSSYTDDEIRRDKVTIFTQTSFRFIKLYTPTVLLVAGGTLSILAGHRILSARYAGVVAAYSVLEQSFDRYRDRVREELGEDRELAIYAGAKEVRTEIDAATGESVKVLVDQTGRSMYARCFDEASSDRWEKTYGYNQAFIRGKQNQLNDRLKARGHVFLNEVYDALGFPHTPEGQVVGWILDSPTGDGVIDFGIYRLDNKESEAFLLNMERSVWLDFNVDGVIWDKI